MKNSIRLLFLFFILPLYSVLNSQSLSELPLPLDPAVKYGVLDNGLTYYIRANGEPKNRASFYMIQNVGAILEEDHQNGLAHFLEHMAFNGTENFPGKGILNTLERHGVAFGKNINAYTSQDETVYNLSEVPVNRPGLMDTCLLVLNDWSDFLLLSEEEIDAERGVIAEEWRTRRNADFRVYRESLPYIYNNSKYAQRDIIGDIDVIRNFKYDEIRDFYHNWYRTDLQAIAVVGDFDADEMENKVLALFSKIPAVENPKERYEVKIPDNEEPIFGLVTDREADQSIISIYIREHIEQTGIENAEQLRNDYIKRLFNRMMSQRISELLQKGDPPFVTGNILRSSLTRNSDVTLIRAIAKTNEEDLALRKILEEAERAKRYGFAPGELDRAKSHFLNMQESRVKEKDKITNDQYARQYRAHYLEKTAYLDVEVELELMRVLFSTITPDDFMLLVPDWFSQKNNVVVISGPESEDVRHLSEQEALDLLQASASMEVEPYEDVELAASLISDEPVAGSVIAEKSIPGLDAEEWTLTNGARVVYRFADYEKDNIGFRAYSAGGSSLYEREYLPSVDMLSSFVPMYGVAEYDQATLQKMLTGKTVQLSLELNELSEGFSGSASPKDFETLMQLIHLRVSTPRFDQEAHQAIKSRYLALMENMSNNPQKIMNDSLTMILSGYHPRTMIMDKDYIQDVELEKIEQVYLERYSDASDFIFFFVGNIQKEELMPFVEKYIASLPSAGVREKWVDRGVREPEGLVEKEIELSLSVPKSTSIVVLNNGMKYTPENLVIMRIISGILDLRFVETIREEEGGTYGVMANTSMSRFPVEKATVFIMFDTDPEKVDYLKGLVHKELEQLVKNGPSQKDLSKTVENLLKEREQNREHNSYWMNALYNLYLHGYNPDDPANYEDIVRSVTTKDVKKLMKKFYRKVNMVDLVFNPAETSDQPE
jgi:zinc protease